MSGKNSLTWEKFWKLEKKFFDVGNKFPRIGKNAINQEKNLKNSIHWEKCPLKIQRWREKSQKLEKNARKKFFDFGKKFESVGRNEIKKKISR